MTGQIAGPSTFSLELVGFVIGVSMIIGAADLIRQPGWAWRRAQENKAAHLVLVLLLPLVGLGIYLYAARPKVAPITAAGRAASLPFERFGTEADQKQREESRPARTNPAPAGFGSFGAITVGDGQGLVLDTGATDRPAPSEEISATFFSTGGTATRTVRSPVALARTYRPRQRTSLTETDEARPAVPSGWKADPTGRHQFRYWDGFQWTENVADAGQQTRDSVSS
jgi:hypothetical protein